MAGSYGGKLSLRNMVIILSRTVSEHGNICPATQVTVRSITVEIAVVERAPNIAEYKRTHEGSAFEVRRLSETQHPTHGRLGIVAERHAWVGRQSRPGNEYEESVMLIFLSKDLVLLLEAY